MEEMAAMFIKFVSVCVYYSIRYHKHFINKVHSKLISSNIINNGPFTITAPLCV